jgi:hypothetical protein
MRQMETSLLWICYPSCTNCMFCIILEVHAKSKVYELGTSTLTLSFLGIHATQMQGFLCGPTLYSVERGD